MTCWCSSEQTLKEIQRVHTLNTLRRLNGNRTHTARALGICIRTLTTRLRQYRDDGDVIPEPQPWRPAPRA